MIENSDPIEAVETSSGALETPERVSVFNRLRDLKLQWAVALGGLFHAADAVDAAPPKPGAVKVAAATTKKVEPGTIEQAKYIQMPTEALTAPLNAPDVHFIPQKGNDVPSAKGPRVNSRVISPFLLENPEGPLHQAALLPPKNWVYQKLTYTMHLDAEAQIPPATLRKEAAFRWSIPLARAAFDTTPTWQMIEAKPPTAKTLPAAPLVVHLDPVLTNNVDDAQNPRGLEAALGILGLHGNRTNVVQKLPYDSVLKVTSWRVAPAPFDEKQEELEAKLNDNEEFSKLMITAKKYSAEFATAAKKVTPKDQRDWIAQMMKEHEGEGAIAATGFILRGKGSYCGPFILFKGVAIAPDAKIEANQGNIVVTGVGQTAPIMMEGRGGEASVKWLNPNGHLDALLPMRAGNPALQGHAVEAIVVRGSKFLVEPEVQTVRIDAAHAKEAGLDPATVQYVATTIARGREAKYGVQVAGNAKQ